MEPIKVRRINYTFNYNHKLLTQKDLQDEDKPSHPLNREKTGESHVLCALLIDV